MQNAQLILAEKKNYRPHYRGEDGLKWNCSIHHLYIDGAKNVSVPVFIRD